jgi:uncharacterized damage-inducible protein DinB
MSLKELLVHDFLYTFNQEDWYAPLTDALNGITFENAVWKPDEGKVNSIAEIVSHILYFEERLLSRLTESMGQFKQAAENDETFKLSLDWTEEAWNSLLKKVENTNLELAAIIENMTEEELLRKFKEMTAAEMISGVTRHNAHHIGQIVMLRKMQGSWPASRKFIF